MLIKEPDYTEKEIGTELHITEYPSTYTNMKMIYNGYYKRTSSKIPNSHSLS